jgi:hypothetical protein
MKLRLALAPVVLLVVVASAAAGVTGRARVGVSGRNDTRGYSAALWVYLDSPATYRKGCCTDTDSGEWLGPQYQATDNASLNGDSSIEWRAIFDRRSGSALSVARANLVQNWTTVATEHVAVPHLVGKLKVGTLAGTAIVTKSPASSSAQVEGALVFPLCPGLHVVADFDALKPFAEPTGTGGTYQVDGVEASTWNREQVETSLHGVSLVGYLPVAKVTATRSGGVVVGRVTDCVGQPMPGVTVRAGGAHAKTTATGRYRVPVRVGGPATVVVTAGGATASRHVG